MAVYDEPATTESDPLAPLISSLFKRMIANPIAIAEGATDAPVVAAAWHPYDMVYIGDGADGEIYDNAVDGDVASLASPDFADGYEYAFWCFDISHDDISNSRAVVVELYRATDAAYSTAWTSSTISSVVATSGAFYTPSPRTTKTTHGINSIMTFTTVGEPVGSFYDATSQKILRARISFTSGDIDAGKIHMYRRKVQE